MKTRTALARPEHANRAAAQRESRGGAAGTHGGGQRDAAQRARIESAFGSAPAQRAGPEEELQMKADTTVQRAGPEEELPLQGQFAVQRAAPEEELLQGRFAVQRAEEEEPLQGRFEGSAPKPNQTGMPDGLKIGVEALSGMDLSDVRVHANSSQPAQLDAHAYAQGNDIHVAPGQEQHLPHEAWHVVQQRQGRVQPTLQMAGVAVNDDASLEKEADLMGAKALQSKSRRDL